MHTRQNEISGRGDDNWFDRRDKRQVGAFYKHLLLAGGTPLECLSLLERWKWICSVAGGCSCMAVDVVFLRVLGGKVVNRHGQLMKVG
jgi:hypothetical protein